MYTVMDVSKKSSYCTFAQASKITQSPFLSIVTIGQTPFSIPAKIIAVPI